MQRSNEIKAFTAKLETMQRVFAPGGSSVGVVPVARKTTECVSDTYAGTRCS